MEEAGAIRKPRVVAPEEGRVYPMGRMRAVFKADTDETASRYSGRNGGLSLPLADRACMRTRMTTCSTSSPEL